MNEFISAIRGISSVNYDNTMFSQVTRIVRNTADDIDGHTSFVLRFREWSDTVNDIVDAALDKVFDALHDSGCAYYTSDWERTFDDEYSYYELFIQISTRKVKSWYKCSLDDALYLLNYVLVGVDSEVEILEPWENIRYDNVCSWKPTTDPTNEGIECNDEELDGLTADELDAFKSRHYATSFVARWRGNYEVYDERP